jgi:alpha-methylacyl-CoA racemase
LRVVELHGRGPGPFGAMILADLGAEVTRIVRPGQAGAAARDARAVPPGGDGSPSASRELTERMIAGQRRIDPVARGRRLVEADLKDAVGRERVLALIDASDVLTEGFRPGVAERLGVGPGSCLGRNPRLVYARVTGWGQSGPYAQVPGHDINYVALSGVLDALRRDGRPPAPPLNLLGDYGGGGMLLVVGILAALVERSASGLGQVVDAAMIDGVSLLSTLLHGMRAEGLWNDEPERTVLGLGAPFYNVYETADGRFLTIGCGEPRFYARLLDAIGLRGQRDELLRGQADPSTWPSGQARLAAVFKGKPLREWRALLEGTDTCFAPVLTLAEAPDHPHSRARGTFIEVDGVVQPAPAPRFSRTPAGTPGE